MARPWGRAAWCARGRRPAREPSAPRASLGASSRSPARPRRRPRAPQPGPTFPRRVPHTGHTFVTVRCLSCSPLSNFARNSPADRLYIQFASLELQRLWAISKNDRVKLRATFAGTVTAVTLGPLYRPREPRPRLATTNSFTKNRNHHENLQSAAPRPHGPLQNASPRPSGARRTGGGGFAALETPPRRVAGVSHL